MCCLLFVQRGSNLRAAVVRRASHLRPRYLIPQGKYFSHVPCELGAMRVLVADASASPDALLEKIDAEAPARVDIGAAQLKAIFNEHRETTRGPRPRHHRLVLRTPRARASRRV
jgi:hypothetical protein